MITMITETKSEYVRVLSWNFDEILRGMISDFTLIITIYVYFSGLHMYMYVYMYEVHENKGKNR